MKYYIYENFIYLILYPLLHLTDLLGGIMLMVILIISID